MCNEIGTCGDSLVAQDKDVVMITVLYVLIFQGKWQFTPVFLPGKSH